VIWIALALALFPGVLIFSYIATSWTLPNKTLLMWVLLAVLLVFLGTSIYFQLTLGSSGEG